MLIGALLLGVALLLLLAFCGWCLAHAADDGYDDGDGDGDSEVYELRLPAGWLHAPATHHERDHERDERDERGEASA